MSRRGTKRADSLHADAYSWQQGQFYPERHKANVQRLHQKYGEYSISEIDAIYRQACRIDFEVQERIRTSELTERAKAELLEWLEDNFHGFSRASLMEAIERAEAS